MQLTSEQSKLHHRALDLSRQHRQVEWQLIEVLQKIDQLKLYKSLGHSSLFQYATRALDLSESVAYSFISVSRKASQVVTLSDALREQRISIAKASRIVSALNAENAVHLIGFAQTQTSREVDFEVARINPKAGSRDSMICLSQDRVQLKVSVSRQFLEKLKRVEALAAQKGKSVAGFEKTLEIVLNDYLKRHDPVQKAERAQQRRQTSDDGAQSTGAAELCTHRVRATRRVPLRAREKHSVVARDGGRCTHVDAQGQRCQNDRWLAIHHIHPVSRGGDNDPENLTTLCWFHHDLVHQLTLPMEGARPGH